MRMAVIGLGRFGVELLRELERRKDLHVIAVDVNEALVDRVSARSEAAVRTVRGFSEMEMRELGIDGDLDVAVIAIGEDAEAAQRWALALCRLGVSRVVARAQTDESAEIMERLLARQRPRLGYEVVRPERDGATRLAARISVPGLVELLELGDEQVVARVRVPRALVGLSLSESGLRPRLGLNLLQVLRRGDEADGATPPPVRPEITPELCFEAGDELLVLGSPDAVDSLRLLR